MSHVCFFREMQWDDELRKWCCADCGRPYEPPDHKRIIRKQGYWKPWTIPLRKMLLPFYMELWRPWEEYRI